MTNRCIGRTKNFNRCARHGSWRFFCNEHKFQWLKVVTLVALIASFFSDINPLMDKYFGEKNDFYGKWEQTFSMPVEQANLSTKGEVTYFKNGKYHYSGEYKVTVTKNDNAALTFNYAASATGDWMVDDAVLTIAMQDREFSIKDIHTGKGADIDQIVLAKFKAEGKPIKDPLAGLSDQYRVLEKSDSLIILEGKTPENTNFTISMKRIY